MNFADMIRRLHESHLRVQANLWAEGGNNPAVYTCDLAPNLVLGVTGAGVMKWFKRGNIEPVAEVTTEQLLQGVWTEEKWRQ